MKNSPLSFVAKLLLAVGLSLLLHTTAGAVNYTLTVSAQGSGTVVRNPAFASYPAGVNVIVTATPEAGWYFANWAGDASGNVNPLEVTMNHNLVITGRFLAYPTYALTLATNGQGSLTVNPPGGSYQSNTVVTATATPASGWVFAGWSGATNSSATPLALAVNSPLALTGNFAQLPAFDGQPVSTTNAVGSLVSFTSHSVGTAPVSYHWFFSGGALTNATNATLTLPNAALSQAGNYWVTATNSYGSATSAVVTLTLTNASGPTNMVNTADEASLRAAIAIGGWIGLGFNGTLTLTNTITITNNVILDGSKVAAAISGGNAVRLFYVAHGASLTATNLTLANGSCLITSIAQGTNADAGAIYNNAGTVTLVGCTMTNNRAISTIYGGAARGGAIFNNGGTVTLYQSSVISNSVVGGGSVNASGSTTQFGLGGAIYITNGTVTIVGCNVSSNFCQGLCYIPNDHGWFPNGQGITMGGAVFQGAGLLLVSNSVFAFNQALGGGVAFGEPSPFADMWPASPAYGGAMSVTDGNLIMDHCRFFANTAKGGDGSDASRGPGGTAFGGAIYLAATLTAGDCSWLGNQALAGNFTVYTNGPHGFGGAIYNTGLATFNRCSVYSNYVQGGSTYRLIPDGTSVILVGTNAGNGLGGGIFNATQLAATNCTIAFNPNSEVEH